jgi:hypothetical protein
MIRLFSSLCMALFCSVSVGSAVTLDWSAVTWTAGSLSNSYDIDPSNPGSDIMIAMSGNTGNFNSGSPSIGTGLGGTGKSSLQLAPTFTSTSQSITVTISFNYTQGVYLQNLNILSVDSGTIVLAGYTDKITNIVGVTATGQSVNAAAVAGGSSVTVSGNSTSGWTASGNGTVAGTSANGNVSVSFGNFRVKQVSFTLSNSGNLSISLASQLIGLDNISYSLTPEVQPGIIGAVLCGLALVGELWRDCRKRRGSKAPG